VTRDALKRLLEDVRSGKLSVAKAGDRLRHFPVEELGFATLDTQRSVRRGFPETVYGPGKTIDQVLAIVSKLHAAGQTALVTRVGPEVHAAVAVRHPKAEYHPAARALVLRSGG
jgi:NCAIR mutase (PurE)-related protein